LFQPDFACFIIFSKPDISRKLFSASRILQKSAFSAGFCSLRKKFG